MQSSVVELTPTASARTSPAPGALLGFQNNCSWKFKNDESMIHFRVGADISLSKGIYYVDWAVAETETANYYAKTKRTKVEVIAQTANKWQFSVDDYSGKAIYKGHSSPSLKLSVTNAPFTKATVTLKLATADANITFSPTSLEFDANHTERFFKINVASEYVAATPAVALQVVFEVGGADAAVFAAPGNMTFSIMDAPTDTSAGTITAWTMGVATRTSNTFSPSVT